MQVLSSLPCFVLKTVHLFCASRDVPRSSVFFWTVPTNSKGFLCDLWLCGKWRSLQGLLKSQRKLGVNTNLSEIIKLQCERSLAKVDFSHKAINPAEMPVYLKVPHLSTYICWSVGRMCCLQASSPDEKALVEAAVRWAFYLVCFGFFFLAFLSPTRHFGLVFLKS